MCARIDIPALQKRIARPCRQLKVTSMPSLCNATREAKPAACNNNQQANGTNCSAAIERSNAQLPKATHFGFGFGMCTQTLQ